MSSLREIFPLTLCESCTLFFTFFFLRLYDKIFSFLDSFSYNPMQNEKNNDQSLFYQIFRFTYLSPMNDSVL